MRWSLSSLHFERRYRIYREFLSYTYDSLLRRTGLHDVMGSARRWGGPLCLLWDICTYLTFTDNEAHRGSRTGIGVDDELEESRL
jgi:hypothetical protein